MWLTVTILVSRDGRGERGGKLFFKRRIFNLSPRWKILTDSRPWSIEICIFHGGLEHCRDTDTLVAYLWSLHSSVKLKFLFFSSSYFFQNQATVTNSSWPIFETKLFIFFLSCLLEGRFSFFSSSSFLKKRGRKKKAFICFRRIVKCNFNVALLQLVL